jgi:hypothetical protein
MLGGTIYSTSLKLDSVELVQEVVEDISGKFKDILVTAGLEEDIFIFSRRATQTIFGWEAQLVPLVLICLVLLNTMMGSVFERVKEIWIYSSLGLAPIHISLMFLAEALIYSVIGGVSGFIVAMGVSKTMTLVSPGILNLNYASLWVVASVAWGMIATIASSVYPMYKAGKLVTPSLERAWKPSTKPKDEEWMIPLPFTYTSEIETGQMLAYIKEFLSAHLGDRAELFTVSSLNYEEEETDKEKRRTLLARVRLVPYDLGIIETVRLHFIFNEKTERWNVELDLHRESGNPDVWFRSNLVFSNTLRKQFLLWKSISEEKKEEYSKMYMQLKEKGS